MEAVEAESEGKFTYHQIYENIEDGKYPEVLEKCSILIRWKRFQFFKVQEIHLYYTGGMYYVNVRLAIDPSLAKLAKRIGNLRHQLAIMI